MRYHCTSLKLRNQFTHKRLWPPVTDIDECALELHKCSDNAVCSDTEGSYNCTCVDGYEGDGMNCASKYKISSVCRNIGWNTVIPSTANVTSASYDTELAEVTRGSCTVSRGYTGLLYC